MFNKKIIFLAVVLVVAFIASSFYYFYQGKNKKDVLCVVNADCTLIYTGEEKCAPCDQSLSSYKCVFPGEVEKIREKRKEIVGNIACAPCPPVSKNFSCACENKSCQKVKTSK